MSFNLNSLCRHDSEFILPTKRSPTTLSIVESYRGTAQVFIMMTAMMMTMSTMTAMLTMTTMTMMMTMMRSSITHPFNFLIFIIICFNNILIFFILP